MEPLRQIGSTDAVSLLQNRKNGCKLPPTRIVLTMVVALIAVFAPLLFAAEMVANCWIHGRTRNVCDHESQAPLLVQSSVASAFALLATPPQ
jgi:hypothetical protein